MVSFLSGKLQPPASHPIPEVHFASASNPPSQSDCPITGIFVFQFIVLLQELIGLMSALPIVK